MNWLAYKIHDSFIEKHADKYIGDLFDLGCGEMPYRTYLLQFASSYTGIDWSSNGRNFGVDIIANLNESLPIRDCVADCVVSYQVLEHLSEPLTMLCEAQRILKPGGYLVLSVPFMWHLHEAPFDFYRFTSFGLRHLLKKAGFIDICVEATGGFWAMWFLKFNYQTVRLIRGPRVLRWLVSGLFSIVWWLDQHLALFLDRFWPAEDETVGYMVAAKKP